MRIFHIKDKFLKYCLSGDVAPVEMAHILSCEEQIMVLNFIEKRKNNNCCHKDCEYNNCFILTTVYQCIFNLITSM